MSVFDALRIASRKIDHQEKVKVWRNDIRQWALDRIGIYLWSKQVEIANSIIRNKKTAVKSCHGSGKSWTASVVIAWWVDTRIDQDSIVVSTAPTYEQVNKILWEYLRSLMAMENPDGTKILPGKITMEDEWKDGSRVVGFGRKPSDTNAHGFQGIHRRQGVLAVLDEACGIPETLWTGVEAITTGIHDRQVAIANPDDPNSELGRIFSNGDNGWNKITISALDTPNFTDEKHEIVPALVAAGWDRKKAEEYTESMLGALISPEWVEDKKKSWGEDSARYQSKVLGEFPSQGVNTLFDQITLAKAIDTNLEIAEGTRPRLGVDVARYGDDYTVVYSYQCGVLRFVDKWAKADLVETSERIDGIARRLNASEVRIDGVGVGAGVYDMVSHKSKADHGDYKVVGMIGNAASPDNHKWVNARAWWYDTLREKMLRGKIDMDFEDKDLKGELEGIQYKFGKSYGAIQIESKDEMISRGVKSPDFADAAMYACADLPVDVDSPIAEVPIGGQFEAELADFLAEDEMSIGPLFDW